jgi:hypothetical protein
MISDKLFVVHVYVKKKNTEPQKGSTETCYKLDDPLKDYAK